MQVSEADTAATDVNSKPSLKEKVGYALGDMGFNFYWKNIEVYLIFFYTDVFKLSAAAVGTMFLVTRIFDAFTDPAMGAIADRTNTRFGKFRPYLLWMALPMAVAGVLTFTTPDLDDSGKLIWAYATYMLMMLVYTSINIPYSAMLGVITSDGKTRTTLSSFRFVGAFSGGIIVTYSTPKLVEYLGAGNDILGWQLTMVVYGVLAAILFITSFLSTQERVKPPVNQQSSVWNDLSNLKMNKPWLVLFALGFIVILTISLRNAAATYYFKYYLEKPDLMGSFLTATMVAYALGAASTPLLSRFFDKRALFQVLMVSVGVLSIALFFVDKTSVTTVYVLGILISLVLGPKSPLVWSMYADTADYGQWKTGVRSTAMIFAAATFSLKLGGAFAGAIIGWLLAYMGYAANQTQTASSTLSIVLLMSVIPGGFAILAAYVARYYTLTSAQLSQIQTELADSNTDSDNSQNNQKTEPVV